MFGQGFNSGFFKAPCFTDTTDIFKDRSGVALYTLDYDGSDSGGATGKYKEGAVFNGSNAQIDTTATLIPSSTDFSISFWIKPENQFGSILARGLVTSGPNAWGFDLKFNNSDNRLGFFRHTGGAYANEHYAETADDSITVGVWQHIVLSFDKSAGAPQFYIDGSAATTNIITYAGGTGSSMATGNIAFNSSYDGGRYRLGNRSNGGLSTSRFKGALDHFRVFNKVVSASEVTTLYSDATDTIQVLGDTSCTAFYNFNNNALDLAGSHNPNSVSNIIYKYDGTPTNVDFGVGGKSNYGARFNGSSSYIDLGTSLLSNRPAFSVSAWVNFDNLNTQNFIFHNSESGTGTELGFYDYGNGNICFQPDASTSQNRGYVSNSGIYTTSEWVHIVMVFDGSATGNSNRLKAYIQGQPRTLTYDGTIPSSSGTSTCNSWIGGRSSTKFSGDIDQVRIFNKALSSSEVSKLYGNGAGEIACEYTATTTNINYPVTNVAYYKLDNSAVDEASGLNGTETNVEYRFGRYGQAAVFNGSSSKIVLPSGDLGINNNNVSLSIWFKTSSITQDDQTLFWIQHNNSPVRIGAILNSSSYGGDYDIRFSCLVSGSLSEAYTNSNILSGNTWYHAVFVKSSTNGMTVYINGSSVATNTGATGNLNNNTSSGATNSIGYYRTSSDGLYFNGQLDQFRIYNSVLSQDQITELYNEKPETDTSNFKTVLYEGTGSTQFISNVGMDLETGGGLLWIKNRDQADSHAIVDNVRGIAESGSNYIASDSTSQELSSTNMPSSLEKSGFFVQGSGGRTNTNNESYVAWVWKGGGDAVSNTDGSITSQVSANTDAGFSIVKYTGNLTAGATVGHGLDYPPELIIGKRLVSTGGNWTVFAEPVGATAALQLNTTIAAATATAYFNDTAPTDSVFTLGSNANLNNTEETIAYCFHSVSEYSKIGSYEGLGTSDVTVSGIGFKPSFIMVKNADATSNWNIYDTARGTIINRMNNLLYPNLNNAESGAAATMYITVNDNGFVVNNANHLQLNYNGDTFIYMAFK